MGAGLSGTLMAVHLAQRSQQHDLLITLINRSGVMARGVAYGTRSADHLLNVPAGRMSAFDDDESHFLRFARSAQKNVQADSFVCRKIFGDYLEYLLNAAAQSPRLVQLIGEVRSIQQQGPVCIVQIDSTEPLEFDCVVLALGNAPPADIDLPGGAPLGDLGSCYVGDPWAENALLEVNPAEPVILLGTGLTMVDVALALQARGQAAPMIAVSRHGLCPQAHRDHSKSHVRVALPHRIVNGDPHLGSWLRALRQSCRNLELEGVDWRDTLASLRNATPGLWRRLDIRQRAQFLRHLRPYWDAHRHRMAPQTASHIEALRAGGALHVESGRLVSVEGSGQQVNVTIRRRGNPTYQTFHAAAVINCTGPGTLLRQSKDVLMNRLRADGLIKADALGLGIEVSDDYAVVRADGSPSKIMYYLGPMLRAQYWECTAVPELRVHAQSLADRLCKH